MICLFALCLIGSVAVDGDTIKHGGHPTTLSPGGPGVVIKVLKCRECGWSVTK